MLSAVKTNNHEATAGGDFTRTGAARVVAVSPKGAWRVRMENHDGQELQAEPLAHLQPQIGNRVLVVTEDDARGFIVGLLQPSGPQTEKMPGAVTTSGGASARVVERPEERIEVRDGSGVLVFEYLPESAKATVSMPTGDLELRAPQGNIHLAASGGVFVQGQEQVQLESKALGIAAEEGEFLIGRGIWIGQNFNGAVARSRWVVGKLEMVAGRILQTAKNIYSRVEGLSQLQAGRRRLEVDKSCHISAERTYVRAEKTVKVAGEKIHLG